MMTSPSINRRRIFALGILMLLCLGNHGGATQPPARLNTIQLPQGVKLLRDIPYVASGHERQRLDLYLPDKSEGLLPVIVWIHGGAWKTGSKEKCPAVWLVTKGYAVASINYRLSQHAPFPAQLQDCKAAIRWLRANAATYSLDPERIGAWGASAGGHLAAMLGVTGGIVELEGTGGNREQSSRVQCVVDWFGRADMTMASSQNDPEVTAAVSQLLGCPVDENREKAIRASPLYYVNSHAPPFLIMHGDQDKRVPLKQSELLTEALKKAGVEVTLHVVRGAGHSGPEFTCPENLQLVEQFFDQHLKVARSNPTSR